MDLHSVMCHLRPTFLPMDVLGFSCNQSYFYVLSPTRKSCDAPRIQRGRAKTTPPKVPELRPSPPRPLYLQEWLKQSRRRAMFTGLDRPLYSSSSLRWPVSSSRFSFPRAPVLPAPNVRQSSKRCLLSASTCLCERAPSRRVRLLIGKGP